MDKELIKEHIKEKSKQTFTNKKYDTFFDGKVLQICFYSVGCRFSKNGNCIMCDYGKSRRKNLSPNDIKEIMEKVLNNLNEQPNILLLNSLGSILDEFEMPRENMVALLNEIANTDIDVIVFETHYSSINNDILQLIKQKLLKKCIEIELGFESSNPKYRKNYLNKIIDNDNFVEKVNLIKSYGFAVETNVIFGMPFLSTENQIQDTLQSILWCFQNNIDRVNLFPMNIKPYTLLYKLYEMGKYLPVKHIDFIKVLKLIPKEYVDKIYLCWYGNRQLYYGSKPTILPICEQDEYDKIMNFYQDFNLHKDTEYREKLLKDIIIN